MRLKKDEKIKRGNSLVSSYRNHDINDYNFGDVIDFDGQWIVDNIFEKECIYCGENNWRKLGCDRINNNKPHTKDNVVPCCRRCNTIRSNKFTVDEMKEIGAAIRKIEQRHKEYSIRRGKKVASYDLDGNLIKEYPNSMQTQEDGYAPRVVRRACEKNEEGYKYKGMYWKYVV